MGAQGNVFYVHYLVFKLKNLPPGVHHFRTYEGFVNFGENVLGYDSDEFATKAMVFMLVGLPGHWKCLVGYVLENGLNSTNLHALTKNDLDMAYKYGLTVHCNGTTSNLECMLKIGCRIGSTLEELDGKFELINEELFFTPDACHMLKLARNALADVKEFKDGDGKVIKWKHIKILHCLLYTSPSPRDS